MSDFAESSVIPSANDDFHATNDYQGLALCDTFDEDGYHAAESLMHVTRVAGPFDGSFHWTPLFILRLIIFLRRTSRS